MPVIAPFGSWESPITPQIVTRASVHYADSIETDDGDVYWVESRPHESGRSVIVRRSQDGSVAEAVPAGFNARTRVHEYGGGAYTVRDAVVYASRFEDQRIYRIAEGAEPVAITPEPPIEAGLRYADPALAERWGIWVRESHRPGSEPVNELVRIPLDGSAEPEVVAAGHDFYAFPRISPDGASLAFVAWDHPNMPWNGTTLYVAPLDGDGRCGASRAVAGGPNESIVQPVWSPGGVLHFCSDRSGWWNPYRLADGVVERVVTLDAEIGSTAWTFRHSRLGFLADGTAVMVATSAEGPRIIVLGTNDAMTQIDPPGTALMPYLAVTGRSIAVVAAAPDRAPAIYLVAVDGGGSEPIAASTGPDLDPGIFSIPETITFDTPDGPAYAFHYAPHHPDFAAPEGDLAPLIVFSHGGPTAATNPALDLRIQYWTSRGFAVVDVNYGGSSGLGRSYWERLGGRWGIVDVRDCALAAGHLVDRGLADPDRLAIRGGSAGGYTTLAVLAFRDDFAAGASHFGVADLELLARDTHKFESRYLDWLVGPLPEARAVYEARSPIHHVDDITCPIILFQGLEDRVVPPEQAEMMAAKLRERGVPVALVEFEGEGHGFRRAENQVRVLEAELSFYGQIFGFEPAGEIDRVPIDGL